MQPLMRIRWGWLIGLLLAVTVVASLGGTFLAVRLVKGPGRPARAPSPTQITADVATTLPDIPAWAFHPLFRRHEPPVVKEAKKYLGIPYLFGGEFARDGAIDCSSYTKLVFTALGVDLPRTTYGQVQAGVLIQPDDLLPGDLIFFQNTTSLQSGATHVGIYIGNDEFIHAAGSIGYVAITGINDPFYLAHWHSVRRVLAQGATS